MVSLLSNKRQWVIAGLVVLLIALVGLFPPPNPALAQSAVALDPAEIPRGIEVTTTGSAAQGATIVVDSTADTIADDGACTLREAIINANNNDQSGSTDCPAGTGDDTVTLEGFYALAIEGPYENAAHSDDLDITDNLTIQGLEGGATIDGNSLYRVFHVLGSIVVTFSNITIQNGNAPYFEGAQAPGEHSKGGGIAISGGTVFVRDSTVAGNNATDGGREFGMPGGPWR